MSDNRQNTSTGNPASKPNIYDTMSIEELETLVSYAFYAEDVDLGKLDMMLDAYDRRIPDPDVDVEAALERFHRYYLGREETFPYTPPDDAENSTQTIRSINHSKPRRFRTLRRIGVAAAVFIILSVVFFNATALGVSLWQSFAQWGRETFRFASKAESMLINEQLMPMHRALAELGIKEKLAPTWIPEGFTLAEFSNTETNLSNIVSSLFNNESMYIIIQITCKNEPMDTIYEMNGEEDVSSYTRKGITHYIMTNEGKMSVVWNNMNYECIIAGDITEAEARKMIDSIYER